MRRPPAAPPKSSKDEPSRRFIRVAELKRIVLIVATITNLAAPHALAEDLSAQPLTRADCVRAGLEWDENANVCAVGVVSIDSRQPLTRDECAAARSTWNESGNVCDGNSSENAESITTFSAQGSILVSIDKTKQRMTILVNGTQRYRWPVSTGARGYSTPSGTYTASSMNEIWYSKQWDNAPMPHAVFFTKEGHAIHGTNEVRRLGKPASHGCVRLSPENAATLYALVKENGLENTRVVLTGLTPGGEGKVAGRASRKTTSAMRSRPRYRTELYFEPRPREGLFRRRWRRR
jgi:L,D-transpeptidase catalytic domain